MYVNNKRESPISYVLDNYPESLKDDKILKRFIKSLISQQNNAGYAPLHVAAFRNNIELIKLLIAKEAFINTTNKAGDTPLHVAVRGGNIEIIKLLIEKGADINRKNN